MEVFVARQPIFNRDETLFAYELLYRNDLENKYKSINHDQATADVMINSFLNIGIEQLSNGKLCFMNFTENFLKLQMPTYFSPNQIVVEILETVSLDGALLTICKELKSLGYKLALDDFILDVNNPYSLLIFEQMDIIKVDFLETNGMMRSRIEALARRFNVEILAEKVETRGDFEKAKKAGYHYFQGYFFAKPTIVSTFDVPLISQSYLRINHCLDDPEPDFKLLTKLIEQDISLSYKLLKLINSYGFNVQKKIHSVRQAIVLLGVKEIQKWIYILSFREFSSKQKTLSEETIRVCLTRGRMCEKIAGIIEKKTEASGFFLAGMFSLMESIMGLEMSEILSDLPLDEAIMDALLGGNNLYGQVLQIVIATEKGDWDMVKEKCRVLKLETEVIYDSYIEAVIYSQEILRPEELTLI